MEYSTWIRILLYCTCIIEYSHNHKNYEFVKKYFEKRWEHAIVKIKRLSVSKRRLPVKKGNTKKKKVVAAVLVNDDNTCSKESQYEFEHIDHNHQFPEDFDIMQYIRTETVC